LYLILVYFTIEFLAFCGNMSLCGFAFLYINTYFSARLVSHEKNSSTKEASSSDGEESLSKIFSKKFCVLFCGSYSCSGSNYIASLQDYCPKKHGYFSALKFLCSDRRPPQCFLKQQSFPRGHVGVVFNQCVVFSFLIIYFAGSSNGRTHPSLGCYRGELG
jgi:hypothetical protein